MCERSNAAVICGVHGVDQQGAQHNLLSIRPSQNQLVLCDESRDVSGFITHSCETLCLLVHT